MDGRLIAIGDIHGCDAAFETLLEQIQPQSEDTLVTLGDYVNRGPGSREVLNRLLALRHLCHLVPLLGNHDELLLEGMRLQELERNTNRDAGLGGDEFNEEHRQFLESCRLFYETETHLFMHASYEHNRPMLKQDPDVLVWQRTRNKWPKPHQSGKVAVVGHTPQRNGEVLDLGYLVCLDTYCWGGGWLTGYDVRQGQIWQVDRDGRVRTESVSE
jgi:serine/threonine protein phosphatase 1